MIAVATSTVWNCFSTLHSDKKVVVVRSHHLDRSGLFNGQNADGNGQNPRDRYRTRIRHRGTEVSSPDVNRLLAVSRVRPHTAVGIDLPCPRPNCLPCSPAQESSHSSHSTQRAHSRLVQNICNASPKISAIATSVILNLTFVPYSNRMCILTPYVPVFCAVCLA